MAVIATILSVIVAAFGIGSSAMCLRLQTKAGDCRYK